jgi:death-on-curing protein
VTEPSWFTYEAAIAAHSQQLRRFGGAPGLRDEGLLRSALERPCNKWHYEGAELPERAAAYAFGLIKNHAFVDGNKRIAFIGMVAFLRMNGIAFKPDQAQSTAIILAVAASEVSEQSLTRWIRDNWPRS